MREDFLQITIGNITRVLNTGVIREVIHNHPKKETQIRTETGEIINFSGEYVIDQLTSTRPHLIQAQLGYTVLHWSSWERNPPGGLRHPVIAWEIEGNSVRPITASFILNAELNSGAGNWYVQYPDGQVVASYGSVWRDHNDWLRMITQKLELKRVGGATNE